MMWDFGGGGQGSSPYYVQQHPAASSSAPSFPAAYGDYNAGPPPMPFMPIGAPASDHIFVDRYHGSTPGVELSTDHGPFQALRLRRWLVLRHNHGHGHASRPTVQQHSSTPAKLTRHGYSARDIEILTDDTSDPRRLPTRANILEAMRRLVKDAHPHDSLFFHYSGHGGQIKDKDGDEIDGYDEIIFPLDHKSAGYISDDVGTPFSMSILSADRCCLDQLMHTMMVKPLPPGCRLTALFDVCIANALVRVLRADSDSVSFVYSPATLAPSSTCPTCDGRVKGSQVTKKWHDYKATLADVITWSGCKDSQTSADTWEQGVATGAMSHAFISSLAQNPKQSYQDLLRSVRVILKKKYSQKPQLSSSHHIDTNLRFIF
ncbi:hypothetical protein BN946_scf184872.g1 [Trametes cinnabarina]|uniref:Peptidase C14 caspase domain-containing protein n=1 Tax=Pycnoporus cinnabarinus TaxID=5643 RepID=A0A060S7M4_PYCCI|nr:hypothetical protein BN946_scf184872.g1 [Trametes cinnabarina]